jgi:hypothetical protein
MKPDKTEELAEIEDILRRHRQARKEFSVKDKSWLELFRGQIKGGAFAGQDSLDVRQPRRSSKPGAR